MGSSPDGDLRVVGEFLTQAGQGSLLVGPASLGPLNNQALMETSEIPTSKSQLNPQTQNTKTLSQLLEPRPQQGHAIFSVSFLGDCHPCAGGHAWIHATPTSLFLVRTNVQGTTKNFAFCRKPSSAQCLSWGLSAAVLVQGLDCVPEFVWRLLLCVRPQHRASTPHGPVG